MIFEAKKILKKYFGYDEFRNGQEEVISAILEGRDALAVMPTGAGKSVCYQIPALLLPGVTIVISPLISLMKDQTDALRQSGIPCYEINSTVSYAEQSFRKDEMIAGNAKLLYVAPERLMSPDFLDFVRQIDISMIAVDEAHCISQWGHDFRKSYLSIGEFVAGLETRPILTGFTATATSQVKDNIKDALSLSTPFELTTGFDRENLYFAVESPSDKLSFVLRYIRSKYMRSGVIYCITRKDVDQLYTALNEAGIGAERYHAGMSEADRTTAQDNFIYDRTPVMVATNAFGMGIDKSNIRFVIHFGMPRTIENYYQEAGRAGRDGELAECILLFSNKDIMVNKFMIERGTGQIETEMAKLQKMISYSTGQGCLRKFILGYFGEIILDDCGSCSNCDCTVEEVDVTTEAQKILSNIKRMGEKSEYADVLEVLLGGKEAPAQFHALPTFGILSEYPQERVEALLKTLTKKSYIEINDGAGCLKLGAKAWPVLKGKQPVINQRFLSEAREDNDKLYDSELYEALEQFRWKAALAEKVPPYIIFSDSTLREIAMKLPKDVAALHKIHGMGESKAEKYGVDLLALLKEEKTKAKKPRTKRSGRRSDTRKESLALYRQGKSVSEIAKVRELNERTILSHLLDCKIEGEKVEDIVQEEFGELIKNAIEKVGGNRMKPIKEVLPEEVSYTSIEYFMRIRNVSST